jgi:hypothetical protein
MSMPFNINSNKRGPIEVFQDDTHFIVRIHPENRDRAKKIPGRQWDGSRKAWVYPKDSATYESLVAEFQKDADRFEIRRPKTTRPPGIKPQPRETDEQFDDQFLLEELRSLADLDKHQDNIHNELQQIRGLLESFKDNVTNQSRTLEELRGTQEHATRILTQFEKSTQEPKKTEINLPQSLDLTRLREIELFEKAVVEIACLSAGEEEESFRSWMVKRRPLTNLRDFISDSHKFLHKQLGQIVGDENPRTPFKTLINKAAEQKIFYIDDEDQLKPIWILNVMNDTRNRLEHSHKNFTASERLNMSINYLMNLAMIWSKVVIEAENSDE